MDGYTDVFLVTGFLGSGKTTFLNRLITEAPADKKLMVLMNEFGEVGIDGTLVEAKDLEILEISKGSIFCACVKTDYIKGLYEIARSIKPDYLVIESTGVANPEDMKKDMQLPLFNGCFVFKEQYCLIDALNFMESYGVFVSVERQIATSTRFIINKTDLAGREQVEKIKAIISGMHEDPLFYETSYARLEPGLVFGAGSGATAGGELSPGRLPRPVEDLDSYVEELLAIPSLSLAPPDILMSATYAWRGDSRDDVLEMDRLLRGTGLIRAKGFVDIGGSSFIYSYVMGTSQLLPRQEPAREDLRGTLVLIFLPEDLQSMDEIMLSCGFVKTGQLARA